jgi:hypothetical protein
VVAPEPFVGLGVGVQVESRSGSGRLAHAGPGSGRWPGLGWALVTVRRHLTPFPMR